MTTPREEWIGRARGVPIEDEIARRGIKLKGGKDRCGPCPVCGGDDRFSINTVKQVFNCRQCGGKGDVIELVRFLDSSVFDAAVETLNREPPPKANGNAKAKANRSKRLADAKKVEAEIKTYFDENNLIEFETLRYHFQKPDGSLVLGKNGKPKKRFLQRRPDYGDPDRDVVWVWGLGAGEYMRRGPGRDWYQFDEEQWQNLPATRERKTITTAARAIPYHLPELIESIANGHTVFIVEGEAKADKLAEWNLAATCNAGGAGKWTAAHASHLRGADVVILPDNDEPGRKHRDTVGKLLQGIAARVRVLELPGLGPSKDVGDWKDAGHTREELDALVEKATNWQPPLNGTGGQTSDATGAEINKNFAPTAPEWPDLNKGGLPATTCANARAAIQALSIKCRYDLFHDKLVVNGHDIGRYAGELSDFACLKLREIISERFKFDPGKEKTFDACIQLCLDHWFDPVVDYLAALKWDNRPRLDTWMHVYLGADDTALNSAIGRLALLALVRRPRQPGCKFDQIIVLEGPEATLKSMALTVLAGSPENFPDQTILGLSDQQQQERLRGKWVYEIADLASLKKAEIEHVKAFASRTHDRARPAYGRTLVELARRSVIFGTTNEETYLKSQTGNRRIWPIRTRIIDIEALRRDRDQLLAEAATLEATGASLVLSQELWSTARIAQDERMEHDPWIDKLADLESPIFACADGRGEEQRITTDELLGETHLNVPTDRQTDATAKRLKHVMRRLEWDGPKKVRIGKSSKRGYSRPYVPSME
jgi:hypothetical protein